VKLAVKETETLHKPKRVVVSFIFSASLCLDVDPGTDPGTKRQENMTEYCYIRQATNQLDHGSWIMDADARKSG